MADTMSVKEAALLWNISERRISYLCNQGRIAGAKKTGRSWAIPANAQKPVDNRIKKRRISEKEDEIRPSVARRCV